MNQEQVTSVTHVSNRLFRFTTTRTKSFRFTAGHFVLIGLPDTVKRPYSIVSGPHDDHLEFYSIKVPNGALTSKLQHIEVGDTVLVNTKTVGSLAVQDLVPGENLYLLSTGTGIAPFMSIIRDPYTFERFNKVIITHTVQYKEELAYDDYLTNNEYVTYYPTVTQEPFKTTGRITDLIKTNKMFDDLGLTSFDPEVDRVMLCGNLSFNNELKGILEEKGFEQGNNQIQGTYLLEKAFVEK